MSVLLVTTAKNLAEKFAALNPGLEYGAIVTDDVSTAKKTLAQIGLSKNVICPMSELSKCLEYLWYDYVLCVEDKWGPIPLSNIVKGYNMPKDKVVTLWSLNTNLHFFVERSLRYFKEHAQEFEMFATGMSTVEQGIDVTKFKRKIFNLGVASQDLYYTFQTAKFAVLCGGGIVDFVMLLLGLHRISSIMTYHMLKTCKL